MRSSSEYRRFLSTLFWIEEPGYATAKCKGSRQITVVDTPYMQYDIALQIETPYLYCPHCARYAVVRPQCIHPKRCMTLRLMGHVARLMQETSARLLSGILRLSQSSILRADKDIHTLIDEARPICLGGRRALIIESSPSATCAGAKHGETKTEQRRTWPESCPRQVNKEKP